MTDGLPGPGLLQAPSALGPWSLPWPLCLPGEPVTDPPSSPTPTGPARSAAAHRLGLRGLRVNCLQVSAGTSRGPRETGGPAMPNPRGGPRGQCGPWRAQGTAMRAQAGDRTPGPAQL